MSKQQTWEVSLTKDELETVHNCAEVLAEMISDDIKNKVFKGAGIKEAKEELRNARSIMAKVQLALVNLEVAESISVPEVELHVSQHPRHKAGATNDNHN
jgi:hypothetical protein